MDGTRRLLEELIVLHELEPSLREVIVEGRVDSGLFRAFLHVKGVEADVFAVDDRVEVGGDLVDAAGFSNGARGRVLTIARYAQARDVKRSLTLVVDADFHYAAPEGLDDIECLLYSDFGSLECYCFEPRVLRKFLEVALRAQGDVDVLDLVNATTDGLVDTFLVRLLLRGLDDPPAMVEKLEKRLKVQSDNVVVDLERLLRDSAPGNSRKRGGKSISITDLAEELVARKAKLSGDMRKYIRGHDISRILIYYLSSRWPRLFTDDRLALKRPSTFEIALLCCLDMHDLAEYELFEKLLERIAA